MRTLVESLKRLYPTNETVKTRVEVMYAAGTLTQEEYVYIKGGN